MTARTGRPARGLHEWPLVVFTSLAIVGSALLVSALMSLATGGAIPDVEPLVWRGVLLLGAGLVVSLAHLGRPWRAPIAIRRLGSSRLSAEVALAGVALGLAVAALALPSPHVALALAAIAAAGLLVSLGLVYSLPGQCAWQGAVVWTPLSIGLALAATFSAAFPLAPAAWRPAAAALLCADLVLLTLRMRRLAALPAGCRPAYPPLFEERGTLLNLRLALADALPLLLLLGGRPEAAAVILAVGVLVDRVQFYALAAQQTTEGEVARADEIIRFLKP
ncbi:MAG TPA: DmsC/YnfH family molybdoenzyme membrane anchor subunit [Vicinamibacterales bacterium]|nr:DmsC/YnfH family molybdoenzyme membrane anchor subunit [Vicinamibacterales bacterium]